MTNRFRDVNEDKTPPKVWHRNHRNRRAAVALLRGKTIRAAQLNCHQPAPSLALPLMSKLPFELLLALRYLRPRRTFVSIITLISVVGVALGVAVLIIVISVMSGFDHDLREKILGFNAHLKIYALDKSRRTEIMGNYADVMRLVSSNKNVRGVAPFVLGPVLLETEPANTNVEQSLT